MCVLGMLSGVGVDLEASTLYFLHFSQVQLELSLLLVLYGQSNLLYSNTDNIPRTSLKKANLHSLTLLDESLLRFPVILAHKRKMYHILLFWHLVNNSLA